MVRGLWHAHVGWLVTPERTDLERWAPDLLKDDDIVKVHRNFPLITLVTFLLPGLIGLAITRSLWGGVTAFLWGSPPRIFFLHHVTWSINSICHFYGSRPFRSSDFSTNNWVLSIVSFGESWHNNHHAFPSSSGSRDRTWSARLERRHDQALRSAQVGTLRQGSHSEAARVEGTGPIRRPQTDSTSSDQGPGRPVRSANEVKRHVW